MSRRPLATRQQQQGHTLKQESSHLGVAPADPSAGVAAVATAVPPPFCTHGFIIAIIASPAGRSIPLPTGLAPSEAPPQGEDAALAPPPLFGMAETVEKALDPRGGKVLSAMPQPPCRGRHTLLAGPTLTLCENNEHTLLWHHLSTFRAPPVLLVFGPKAAFSAAPLPTPERSAP